MSDYHKILQIFIASPSDLADERTAIKGVADSLNQTFGKVMGLQVQLLGWEDRLPGYGRPQAQINEDVDRADLFIGFLWSRWGSDPGNDKYSSGFEEEFERAKVRCEATGTPEIWLFFKEIDPKQSADPGEQLSKVQAFRDGVFGSKKLLCGSFSSVSDWKELINRRLQTYLLTTLKRTPIAPDQRQVEMRRASPPQEAKGSSESAMLRATDASATQQAVGAWKEQLGALEAGDLSGLAPSAGAGKLRIARLGLILAGLTSREVEPQVPGAHLLNLLFGSREKLRLTRLERLLVLKANITCQSDNQPGWFWLRNEKLKTRAMLVFLACFDEDPRVRRAALGLVTALGLDLRARRSRKGPAPIEILCFHSDGSTRKQALEFLADQGGVRDLPLVEKLVKDPDDEIRTQAEETARAIRLRADVSGFFSNCVATSQWLSEDDLLAIKSRVSEVQSSSLKNALAHPDAKVRMFAARELAGRGLMSRTEIGLLKDSEAVCEVLEAYYLSAIGEGQTFSSQEIRESLKHTLRGFSILGHSGGNPNRVVARLFEMFSYEELVLFSVSESEDAILAYRRLVASHFDRFGAQVRDDLANGFSSLRAKLEAARGPHLLPMPENLWGAVLGKWVPDVPEFVSAALSGLATHGLSSDRTLVLEFLDDKSEEVRVAALAALRRVGDPSDGQIAEQIAGASEGELAVEAAKTALALDPGAGGSAARFLKSPKHLLVKLAILALLGEEPRVVWPFIETRLSDPDDEIRKLVCAYAIKKLSPKRLEAVLKAYAKAEHYYYNVVFLLDRALYSKPPLRRIFVAQALAVLD